MNRQRKWLTMLALWLLAMVAHAGTVTYVYTDPQGTPLAEANASGTIIATYDYAPYGQAVTSMSGAPDGPGYTGHVNDPETGLVYMQARYYDPAVGRFLSVDPVNLGPGSRYAYASNNPVLNIDPNGLKGQSSQQEGCNIECKRDKEKRSRSKGDEPYTGFVGVYVGVAVVAIDGAGGYDESDNSSFHSLAAVYGAKMYDGKVGFGRAAPKSALKYIKNFISNNAAVQIYIIGYSAGGDDAVWLANKLADLHIPVSGMVTFDPHVHWRSGYTSYAIGTNVQAALNIYQRNRWNALYNTFRGSPVEGAENINLTGKDVGHSTIVTYGVENYSDKIEGVFSH